MDHLNRHTYRSLLQQAQATIDQSAVKVHDKLVVTEQTMEELNLIFNRFGLTPTDMTVPWRPGTPKTGLATYDDLSDDENALTNPTSPTNANTQSSPAVSIKALTVSSIPTLAMQKLATADAPKVGIVKLKGKTTTELEEQMAEIKVANKFKTYLPSSWRLEKTSKKEKGVKVVRTVIFF